MTLNVSNALSGFNLAEMVELDCGTFDIKIRQAAVHNESFRAAVAKKALEGKKKSLVTAKGTLTGSQEQDVELIVEYIIVGWGERPLLDNDGKKVPDTKENFIALFTETHEGRVLFGKVQQACIDDSLFQINEEDEGNS